MRSRNHQGTSEERRTQDRQSPLHTNFLLYPLAALLCRPHVQCHCHCRAIKKPKPNGPNEAFSAILPDAVRLAAIRFAVGFAASESQNCAT
jgi:hypothetical protein